MASANCKRCGGMFFAKPSALAKRSFCSKSCGSGGRRRGMIRELQEAFAKGRDGIVEFAAKHSIPEPNTGCWLWLGPVQQSGYGYLVDPRQSIVRESMPRTPVHRMVCEAVHRPMTDDEHARHLCHNKGCVNPEHLAPGTPSENLMDSVRAGYWTFTRGTGNGRAKMSEEQVLTLRREFKRNTPGQAAHWAAKFGVDQSNIRQAVSGRSWAHL